MSKVKDALIINSYAGSLVLGATAAKMPIRASFEDVGFGIEAQKLNFPKLRYVDELPWPAEDLAGSIVVSHPPCAAFSNQNNTKTRRGLETDAFKCHRQVMDYAMGNGCEGLAIESVPGAMKAAAEYAKYARKYKYTNFFVYLNSASFGVPQWRPRAWMLFFKDLGKLTLSHDPSYRCVDDIVQKPADVRLHPKMEHLVNYFQKKFRPAGFDYEGWLRYENVGGFFATVSEFCNVENCRPEIDRVTGVKGLYGANLPRKLDPMWFSPVIMAGSFFTVHGRPLTQIEYQRVMGYPDTWKWPASMDREFLKYLSKGVCPPVAEWITRQMRENIERTTVLRKVNRTVAPGETADIRPSRQEAVDGIRLAHQLPLPISRRGKSAVS